MCWPRWQWGDWLGCRRGGPLCYSATWSADHSARQPADQSTGCEQGPGRWMFSGTGMGAVQGMGCFLCVCALMRARCALHVASCLPSCLHATSCLELICPLHHLAPLMLARVYYPTPPCVYVYLLNVQGRNSHASCNCALLASCSMSNPQGDRPGSYSALVLDLRSITRNLPHSNRLMNMRLCVR